jgi:hypothetical protein
MQHNHRGSKQSSHALRLDLASVVQGLFATLAAFTIAYLVIRP